MERDLRPVSIGLLLGLLSLVFGILWAVYLTIAHEEIHGDLEAGRSAFLREKFVVSPEGSAGHVHSTGDGPMAVETNDRSHSHDSSVKEKTPHDHPSHGHGAMGTVEAGGEGAPGASVTTDNDMGGMHAGGHSMAHDDPVIEEAHERLARGHLHAMGLGLVTIVLSVLMAFLGAPSSIKTLSSALIGVGSVFYPLSWIIMGYRTTSMGGEPAAESVFLIAAPATVFVFAGVAITLFYVAKGVFSR